MDSKQCNELILAAKVERAMTFADIAAEVGRSEVWTTSAIFGQARMDPAEAEALVALLGLSPDVSAALQAHPMKGSLDSPVPVDPLLYRFHEVTQVYGTTIKARRASCSIGCSGSRVAVRGARSAPVRGT